MVRQRRQGTATLYSGRNANARALYRSARQSSFGSPDDIFAVNPVRRSGIISLGSWAMLIVPAAFLRGDIQALLLIGFGWMAAAGIVFVTPIFFWSLAEVGWSRYRRRRHPGIEELDISPRALSLLTRHGFETIEHVDRTPDSSLLLLSNMDPRTLHEIRRAINIWKYRRWQDRGFPLGETPDSVL